MQGVDNAVRVLDRETCRYQGLGSDLTSERSLWCTRVATASEDIAIDLFERQSPYEVISCVSHVLIIAAGRAGHNLRSWATVKLASVRPVEPAH